MTLLSDVQAMIETLKTNRAYGPYSVTTKDGTFTMNADGQVHHEPFEEDLTGFNVTAPIRKKLQGFARRLRLFGQHTGSTNIGADRYEIQVDRIGYTVLSKNGKPNPCLDEFEEIS